MIKEVVDELEQEMSKADKFKEKLNNDLTANVVSLRGRTYINGGNKEFELVVEVEHSMFYDEDIKWLQSIGNVDKVHISGESVDNGKAEYLLEGEM